MSEPIPILPLHHRFVIFLSGKLAQRETRWWKRVAWVDRLDEAREIVDEWEAIVGECRHD